VIGSTPLDPGAYFFFFLAFFFIGIVGSPLSLQELEMCNAPRVNMSCNERLDIPGVGYEPVLGLSRTFFGRANRICRAA
jgi:hypothetical protein